MAKFRSDLGQSLRDLFLGLQARPIPDRILSVVDQLEDRPPRQPRRTRYN